MRDAISSAIRLASTVRFDLQVTEGQRAARCNCGSVHSGHSTQPLTRTPTRGHCDHIVLLIEIPNPHRCRSGTNWRKPISKRVNNMRGIDTMTLGHLPTVRCAAIMWRRMRTAPSGWNAAIKQLASLGRQKCLFGVFRNVPRPHLGSDRKHRSDHTRRGQLITSPDRTAHGEDDHPRSP